MSHKLTTFPLLLLLATLIVASILTFLALGAANPIPWLLLVLGLAIPLLNSWREKRHFVTWNRDLSVGIEALDDDHRKMIDLINQLQTAILYGTGENAEMQALDELMEYTTYHFQREEELMEKYRYPGFEEHRKQHREMVSRMEDFKRDYGQRGRGMLQEVVDYLKGWLVDHVSGTDQQYRFFLREKGVR